MGIRVAHEPSVAAIGQLAEMAGQGLTQAEMNLQAQRIAAQQAAQDADRRFKMDMMREQREADEKRRQQELEMQNRRTADTRAWEEKKLKMIHDQSMQKQASYGDIVTERQRNHWYEQQAQQYGEDVRNGKLMLTSDANAQIDKYKKQMKAIELSDEFDSPEQRMDAKRQIRQKMNIIEGDSSSYEPTELKPLEVNDLGIGHSQVYDPNTREYKLVQNFDAKHKATSEQKAIEAKAKVETENRKLAVSVYEDANRRLTAANKSVGDALTREISERAKAELPPLTPAQITARRAEFESVYGVPKLRRESLAATEGLQTRGGEGQITYDDDDIDEAGYYVDAPAPPQMRGEMLPPAGVLETPGGMMPQAGLGVGAGLPADNPYPPGLSQREQNIYMRSMAALNNSRVPQNVRAAAEKNIRMLDAKSQQMALAQR